MSAVVNQVLLAEINKLKEENEKLKSNISTHKNVVKNLILKVVSSRWEENSSENGTKGYDVFKYDKSDNLEEEHKVVKEMVEELNKKKSDYWKNERCVKYKNDCFFSVTGFGEDWWEDIYLDYEDNKIECCFDASDSEGEFEDPIRMLKMDPERYANTPISIGKNFKYEVDDKGFHRML